MLKKIILVGFLSSFSLVGIAQNIRAIDSLLFEFNQNPLIKGRSFIGAVDKKHFEAKLFTRDDKRGIEKLVLQFIDSADGMVQMYLINGKSLFIKGNGPPIYKIDGEWLFIDDKTGQRLRKEEGSDTREYAQIELMIASMIKEGD